MRSCMERSAKDRNLIISDDSAEGIFASVTENGTPMLTNQQVMSTSEEKKRLIADGPHLGPSPRPILDFINTNLAKKKVQQCLAKH